MGSYVLLSAFAQLFLRPLCSGGAHRRGAPSSSKVSFGDNSVLSLTGSSSDESFSYALSPCPVFLSVPPDRCRFSR